MFLTASGILKFLICSDHSSKQKMICLHRSETEKRGMDLNIFSTDKILFFIATCMLAVSMDAQPV